MDAPKQSWHVFHLELKALRSAVRHMSTAGIEVIVIFVAKRQEL